MSPLASALRRAVGVGAEATLYANTAGEVVVYVAYNGQATVSLPVPEAGFEDALAMAVDAAVDRLLGDGGRRPWRTSPR